MGEEKNDGATKQQEFNDKEALVSGFEVDPAPFWNELGGVQLHRKRSHHGCVLVDDDRILVVGGYEGSNERSVLRSVEVFDRQTKKWDKKWPKLNQHRAEHAAVKVGNVLYVMGGIGADGECLDSMECLDLSLKSPEWVVVDRIKLSSKKRGCTAVANGYTVYVIGGKNNQDDSILNHVDVFDVALQKRSQGPLLKTSRYGCASVLVEDTIYVVGGQDGTGSILNTMESLEIDSSRASWQSHAATLASPRLFPALTTVSHNVFVIGGKLNDGACLRSVEVVDTKRNAVWPCVNLSHPLHGCTAVTVSDSRIGAIAGCSNTSEQPLNSMQVLKLEFAAHDMHVAAVKQELKEVRASSGASFTRVFGDSRNKSETLSKLKAYLKELKHQGSAHDDSYDDSESSGDEFERSFENGLPIYGDGRIKAKKELKESGQARVFKGTMRANKAALKQDVAIKVFKSRKDWDDCKHELMTLLKISGHPNVMEVLDFFEVPMPAFVMRYVSGGDLRDRLDKKGKITGKRAVGLLQGIGEGLGHLHRNKIVHRDLKSLNILLEGKDLRPVLIDLGLGKRMPNASQGAQFQTRIQGTAGWMAPEMISSGTWSTKTDMYALGVIMWEVLTGAFPYPRKNWEEVTKFVRDENGCPDTNGQMKNAKVPQQHQELVKALWHKDPSQRPSTDDFLSCLK